MIFINVPYSEKAVVWRLFLGVLGFFFPQGFAQDLADMGFGEFPAELHEGGDLVAGQVLAAEFDDLLRVGFLTFL